MYLKSQPSELQDYPPVVKIDSVFGVKRVTGAYRDTLRFYFTVTDVEGDTVFYYKSADTLGSEWRRVVTFTGDSGLLGPGSGDDVVWATGGDLAGVVGKYYFKVECSDVEIRFWVFESEGDSLSYRYRYRFDSV